MKCKKRNKTKYFSSKLKKNQVNSVIELACPYLASEGEEDTDVSASVLRVTVCTCRDETREQKNNNMKL